jgi:uncharacterized membrane protein
VIQLANLLLATIAFVGTHLLLSHIWRLKLIGAVGEARFTLLYSIVAFATLGWVAVAYRAIEDELPIWIAPDWSWWIASALMLLASILLVGSFVRNPAFPHPGAAQKSRAATGVFALTRHPMNWSFALWAIVHLALWGEARNLVVDTGILILAIGGSIGQDRKKRASMGQAWRQWEGKTSFVPFGALLAGRARWRDVGRIWPAALGGLVFWLVFVTWHAPAYSPIVWLWMTFL